MSNLNDFLSTSGSQNYKLIPAPRTLIRQDLYGVSHVDFPTSNGEINGWFTAPANCKLIRVISNYDNRYFAVTTDGSIPNDTNDSAIRYVVKSASTDKFEIPVEPGNDVRITLCNNDFTNATTAEIHYFEFYGEV